MYSKKKWFHFFSFFLLIVSWLSLVFQMFSDKSVVLEFSLGKGEGEPFISSVFIFDSISNIFIFMVGSVSFLVLKYAYWYMEEEKKWNNFFITFFVFVFFMFLLCVSSSLFWVMLGWDGLGISSFCLVMFFSNWKSFNSALITFLMNRFGDFFFLLSIWCYSCVFFKPNSVELSLLGILIVITGMTKSAQVPFSAWLPAAMAAPTPVSSLVHSSTLVTAGVFLFARFHSFLNYFSLKTLLLCSLITIILSGVTALGENDLKKIIALSTLSHLGFMMFFLSKSMVSATMIHLLVHAFFKSLLFMAAGVIIHFHFNNQDIRKLSSMNTPLTLTMLIALMANMGVPFLSGFYSKEILIFGLFSVVTTTTLLEGVGVIFSILLTCLYSLRMMKTLLESWEYSPSVNTTSILNFKLLNWMIFSSLFSCLFGGLIVWVVADPCETLESSLFLKNVKITVLLIFFSSFFLKFSKKSFPSFTQNSAKMWFIYEFSKFFSKISFSLSSSFTAKVDLKGILSKTPNLQALLLKEELLLTTPKKLFFVGMLMILIFFSQTVYLNI